MPPQLPGTPLKANRHPTRGSPSRLQTLGGPPPLPVRPTVQTVTIRRTTPSQTAGAVAQVVCMRLRASWHARDCVMSTDAAMEAGPCLSQRLARCGQLATGTPDAAQTCSRCGAPLRELASSIIRRTRTYAALRAQPTLHQLYANGIYRGPVPTVLYHASRHWLTHLAKGSHLETNLCAGRRRVLSNT